MKLKLFVVDNQGGWWGLFSTRPRARLYGVSVAGWPKLPPSQTWRKVEVVDVGNYRAEVGGKEERGGRHNTGGIKLQLITPSPLLTCKAACSVGPGALVMVISLPRPAPSCPVQHGPGGLHLSRRRRIASQNARGRHPAILNWEVAAGVETAAGRAASLLFFPPSVVLSSEACQPPPNPYPRALVRPAPGHGVSNHDINPALAPVLVVVSALLRLWPSSPISS